MSFFFCFFVSLFVDCVRYTRVSYCTIMNLVDNYSNWCLCSFCSFYRWIGCRSFDNLSRTSTVMLSLGCIVVVFVDTVHIDGSTFRTYVTVLSVTCVISIAVRLKVVLKMLEKH